MPSVNDIHAYYQMATSTSYTTQRAAGLSFDGSTLTLETINSGGNRHGGLSDMCRLDGRGWVRNITQDCLSRIDVVDSSEDVDYGTEGVARSVDDRGVVYCRTISSSSTSFITIEPDDTLTTRTTSGIASGYYVKNLCPVLGTNQVYLMCSVASGLSANHKIYTCDWTGGSVTEFVSSAANGNNYNVGYDGIMPRYGGGCYVTFGVSGSGCLRAYDSGGSLDWTWTTSETFWVVPSVDGHSIWIGSTNGGDASYQKYFINIDRDGNEIAKEQSRNGSGQAFKCATPCEVLQSANFDDPYHPTEMIGGGFSGSYNPDAQGFAADCSDSYPVTIDNTGRQIAQNQIGGNGITEVSSLRSRTHISRASHMFRGGKFYYAKKVYNRQIAHCPS